MKNDLQKGFYAVVNDVKEKLKNEHYEIEVPKAEADSPDFTVIMKNAQGDVTEARKTRAKLEGILKDALKKHLGFDKFTAKVTTVNKQDDLMFYVEVIFP